MGIKSTEGHILWYIAQYRFKVAKNDYWMNTLFGKTVANGPETFLIHTVGDLIWDIFRTYYFRLFSHENNFGRFTNHLPSLSL